MSDCLSDDDDRSLTSEEASSRPETPLSDTSTHYYEEERSDTGSEGEEAAALEETEHESDASSLEEVDVSRGSPLPIPAACDMDPDDKVCDDSEVDLGASFTVMRDRPDCIGFQPSRRLLREAPLDAAVLTFLATSLLEIYRPPTYEEEMDDSDRADRLQEDYERMANLVTRADRLLTRVKGEQGVPEELRDDTAERMGDLMGMLAKCTADAYPEDANVLIGAVTHLMARLHNGQSDSESLAETSLRALMASRGDARSWEQVSRDLEQDVAKLERKNRKMEAKLERSKDEANYWHERFVESKASVGGGWVQSLRRVIRGHEYEEDPWSE